MRSFYLTDAGRVRDHNEDSVIISKNTEDGNAIVENSATVDVSERVVGEDKVFTVGDVEFTMKYVEGGIFNMGATPEQQDPNDDEKPTHQVILNYYYIGETEVTQALWTAVMGNTVRDQRDKESKEWPMRGEGNDYPMYYISWEECQEFITKLNNLTGRTFRLPTEAEWEFAARGGNKSKGYQYSGSNNLDDVAWYWKNSGDSYLSGTDADWDYDRINNNNCKTHPVKTKQPNELGIYDMSGNVWEWCQDWFGDYSSSSQTNPTGASSGYNRVFRGGSWSYGARDCRSAERNGVTPVARDKDLGLRLCLSD